jgi:hypothetical protein
LVCWLHEIRAVAANEGSLDKLCDVSINGTSEGKQLMPGDDRDLCEICWSPLQTLMKKGP